MKNILIIFAFSIILISCGQNPDLNKKQIEEQATNLASEQINKDSKKSNGETRLCKIDGVEWGYTKGSGIVTTNRETGRRNAIFTFSKKLKKGKETVQLEYDVETNEINRVIVDVKRSNKEGKIKGKMFTALKKHKKEYTGSVQNIGELNITGVNGKASGSAQFYASDPYHDHEAEFEEKYRFVEITDLKFKGVGFSDLASVKKQLESLSSD